MAENVFGFGERDVKRIGKAVRASEAQSLGGGVNPNVYQLPTLFAEVTDVDSTDKFKVAWKQVTRNADGTWSDGQLIGTLADNPAYEINEGTPSVGDRVILSRMPIRDTAGGNAVVMGWTFSLGGGLIRYGKVTSVYNCRRMFQVNPCDADGSNVDTTTTLTVYTGTPTQFDDAPPLGYRIDVDDVVPFLSDNDDNHYQVNPYKYISFGYHCASPEASNVVHDLSRLEFNWYDFNLNSDGNPACDNEADTTYIQSYGKVDWAGMRFTWYGASGDTLAKRVIFDPATQPYAVADSWPVAFEGAGGSSSVTQGTCPSVATPNVTVTASVPAVKGGGCNAEGVVESNKIKEIEFKDGFRAVYNSGTSKLEVELLLQDTDYTRIIGGSLCGLKVEVCYEEKEVVTNVVCNGDGTISVTKETVKVIAGCSS
jgi:hypothetical protein